MKLRFSTVVVFSFLVTIAAKAQETPLIKAVIQGNRANIEALLAKGADVNAANEPSGSYGGWTPLHYASHPSFGKKEIAELLLSHGANVNAKDRVGATPLHINMAKKLDQKRDIGELLVARGADVNARNQNGWTPLGYALGHANIEFAAWLVTKGARVDLGDYDGTTPLINYASRGETAIVEWLLVNGANTKAVNNRGETALHAAAGGRGSKEMVALLLAKGADVHAKDIGGDTALYQARLYKHDDVAELLAARMGPTAAQDDASVPPAMRAQASVPTATAPAPGNAADTILLSCSQTDPPLGTASETATLRIDLSTGLVEQLAPSGQAFTNRVAAGARITDYAIVWSQILMDTGLQTPERMNWSGTIDRLSGTASIAWFRYSTPTHVSRTNFNCRLVTKGKF